MPTIHKFPPATLAQVVEAIDGYRRQLDDEHQKAEDEHRRAEAHRTRTDLNLLHLRDMVLSRIDYDRAFK